ncbi:MAG: hypothetical protein J1E98_13185 [Lachnospiraceae bacterium]|nr:hypothetical protein [Lachnospiraceae bacterium]
MENNFDIRSFVSKVGETVSVKGKEVTDKAKDFAEKANLKSQIKTCEDVIKKNYIEIGKLYYELHASDPEADYEEYFRAIENAKNAINDLEDKISQIN